MKAAGNVSPRAVEFNDAFIKQWSSGGQSRFLPVFTASQHEHVQRVLQQQLPDPTAFTGLLYSLISSVTLPSSPSLWPSAVASFLSDALDKTTLLAPADSASIAQTLLVDAMGIACQPSTAPGRDSRRHCLFCADVCCSSLSSPYCPGMQLDETSTAERSRFHTFGRDLIVSLSAPHRSSRVPPFARHLTHLTMCCVQAKSVFPLRAARERWPEDLLEALDVWSAKNTAQLIVRARHR